LNKKARRLKTKGMGKYSYYSVSGPWPGAGEGSGQIIGHFDGSIFEGSMEYNVHWVYLNPRHVPGWQKWDDVIHAPHEHQYPEVLFHLGTDPQHPMDLGAEVVMHMGPEMEEHVITTSGLVYIPANLVHGWWDIRKITRPFIIAEIHQNGRHTEKSHPELVPEEIRQHLLCVDQNYLNPEKIVQFPAGIGPNFDRT